MSEPHPEYIAGDAIRAEKRAYANILLTQISVRDSLMGGAGSDFWRAVLAQVQERLGEVVE